MSKEEVIARKTDEEKTPTGGWLGPPSLEGLAPLATAIRADKDGKWLWKKNTLTDKQKKKHKKFQKQMAKADSKGIYRW